MKTPVARFRDKMRWGGPFLRRGLRGLVPVLGIWALSACEMPSSPVPPSRPDAPLVSPLPPQTPEQSEASQALSRYYAVLQNDLLTRGLLRTDGGGPDTRYGAEDLIRNFERLAFYTEYPGTGSARAGVLGRWQTPVRISTVYGPSVPRESRATDGPRIDGYAKRLARITQQDIAITKAGRAAANFHIFVTSEDDRDFLADQLADLLPARSQRQAELFLNQPRSVFCLVVAFSNAPGDPVYSQAIALIRAEQPDLMRHACIHEEIAQGLGLPNDSPEARPSIFNDDDEFALLTSHDEALLSMLYDPALAPGMTPAQARPIFARKAQLLVPGSS